MKKKFARILMAFVMVLCVCTLSACNKDSDKNNSSQDAKVTSIEISLTNDSYELVDGTIIKAFGGGSYQLTSADFKVTAKFDDNTSLTLPPKTETQDGYTFVSTIPDPVDGNTPIGNYTITFGYEGLSETKVINFIVVPAVELESFTYNGSTQTTVIKNASALSTQNYTATISNEEGSCSSAKDAGTYTAKVNITYTGADAESHDAIPTQNVSWTISPATATISVKAKTTTYGEAYAYSLSDLDATGLVGTDNLSNQSALAFVYSTTQTGTYTETKPVDAGTYYVKASGLTASNYAFAYTEGALTINKADLSLSLANKIDGEDCVDDKSQRKALFYGQETEYTTSDITINSGLKYNDNLAGFGKFVFEYKPALEPDTAYTTTKPKNAGTYTVRFKEVEDDDSTENYHQNYNITATATATMTIHKAGVRINISDVTAEYGDDISKLNIQVSVGGVLLQHVETKGYSIINNYSDADMPGYAIINDATLVYDDNVRNIFGTYLFEFGYLSHNQTEEKDEFTLIDTLNFIYDGDSNKYKIRLKETYLSEIIENNPNYEFVVDEGVLKVTKKEIVLDSNNSSWKLDGNNSHATYNDEGRWEVIIESTGANQTFTLSTDYSEVLSITYKINDESTNIVKDKGYYTITATITLTDDEHYTLSTTSVVIDIDVTENPFGSADGVSPAITYTSAGGSAESKTFNEFANTGEVQEGDIFKFMLKNQSSSSSSEPTTEPQVFRLIGTLKAVPYDDVDGEGPGSSSRTFARYEVYLNDEPLSVGADGYYEISINSDSGRYLYLRIVAVYITMTTVEDEEEIFSKMFILPEVQSDETPSFTLENTNGSNSKLFEVRKNKYSGELEAITYENGKKSDDLYYKLAKGQTKLNIIVDEKYISSGYYIEAVESGRRIPIDSTVVTIENIKAYIRSTETSSCLKIYDNESRLIVNIGLIVWSEIKNVNFTFESFYEMEEESSKTEKSSKTKVVANKFTGYAGDGIAIHEDFGGLGILTNIEIEFEEGYSEAYGYSYKIFEADGVTEYNYSIIPALGTYKEYWIVAYKNGVEIGKSNWGYMFDVSLKDTNNQTSTYGDSIIASRNDIIHTEADKFALSMDCNNENIQVSSKVKLNGASGWKDEVALSDECSLIDWKLEIIYKGTTHTFTKTFGVVKQDKTFSKTWLNGYYEENDKEYDDTFVYEYTEETSSTPIRETFGIRQTLLGYTCGDSFRMNYNKAEHYVTEIRNNASGFSLKFGEYAPEGLSVSEREFVVLNGKPIIKFTLSNSTYIYVEFGFSGTLDKNVNVKEATITSMSDGISRNVDVTGEKATINLKTSVDMFEIEFENYFATGVLKKIKDADGTELEDSEDNIIYKETQSLTYLFGEAGTYKLTIISSDGTTHKDITIVVSGDPVPFVEFEVVADKTEDADAEDKKYKLDFENMEEMIFSEDTNLSFTVDDYEMSVVFYAYAGANHGFKIYESGAYKYLILKDFASSAIKELYDVYGKKITIAGDQTFKVKILTDDDGNEYVAFSSYMTIYDQTMKFYIRLYLYDKVPFVEFEVVSDKTKDADAEDKKFKADIEDFEAVTATEDSNLIISFVDEGFINVYGYVGTSHGFKISKVDEVKYLTIKALNSYALSIDKLYDVEGKKITINADQTFNLAILKDGDGNEYVFFSGSMIMYEQTINVSVCLYLYDKVPDFAITVVADKTSNASASDFEYKNDIIEYNEDTGTSTVVGDFQPDEDENGLIMLVGENPGYAITTDGGKEYITINEFESAKYEALYTISSESEDPVRVTFVDGKANIEILDNNGVKFVYLVAVVDDSDREHSELATICIIFSDTLPEGFFGSEG